MPTEFYGTVTYYSSPAIVGGVIKAYYSNNILCGEFTIENEGYYGLLSCLGDDNTTSTVEGAPFNSSITFSINSLPASSVGVNTTEGAAFRRVDIAVPILRCGDNFCDPRESYATCPEDCTPSNTTGNGTGTGTGTGGGGD
ncbi:hypothetical protein ACFLTH_13125, partial [Bacteroidota bacterium]